MLKHADHKIKALFLEEFAGELIINSRTKSEKPEIKELIGAPEMMNAQKDSKEIEELAARIQASQKEFTPSMFSGGIEAGGGGPGRPGGRGGGMERTGGGEGAGGIGGEGAGGYGKIGLRIKRGLGPSPMQKQIIKPIDVGSLYSLSAQPGGKSRFSIGEGEIDLGKLNPLLKDREILNQEGTSFLDFAHK